MKKTRETVLTLSMVCLLVCASVWLGGCGGSAPGASDVVQSAAVSATTTTPPTTPPPPLTGQIKSLSLTSGTLASFVLTPPPPPPGETAKPDLTINVTSSTKYTAGPETITADKLKVGLAVEVKPTGKPVDGAVTATAVNVLPPMVGGKITKLTLASGALKSFVLTPPPPPPGQVAPPRATISVNAKTKYLAGAKVLTAKDLKTGMKVDVILQAPLKNSAGLAVEVRIAPPTVAGLVKTVTLSGVALASFILTPPTKAGATQPADLTIAVTEKTTYAGAPGATVTSADVKEGLAVEVILLAPPANAAATAVAVRILPPPATQ